jgi:hypothetical protein
MNSLTPKRTGFAALLLLALVLPSISYGQNGMEQFLRAQDDASKLIGAYITPSMKAVGYGLSGGWTNTAAVHKLGGVDLTFTASAVRIPTGDRFFNFDNLNTSEIELVGDDRNVPTLFGPNRSSTFSVEGQPFDGPPGLGLKERIKMNAVPVPMLQLGIGLVKKTEIKFRYIPTQRSSSSEFGLIGFGVMHDLKQHIPVVKHMPFDISGFVGYTKMKSEFDLSGSFDGENQVGLFDIHNTVIMANISKKIAILTVYGGIGYTFVKSNLNIDGVYEIPQTLGPPIQAINPVDISVSDSSPRMNAGFRVKLAVLTLHGEYTVQKYSLITAGVGISVR